MNSPATATQEQHLSSLSSTSARDAKRRTRAELIQLGWPIAVAMGGETVMGLVDAKLVGGLGRAALGGVGLGVTLTYLGYAVVMGIMRGVKVRTAFAVGEQRAQDGLAYARAGMWIAVVVGSLMFVLGRDVSGLLAAMGTDPELIAPATQFFAAITWGSPATAVLVALVQHRQALGDSRSPMVVALAANAVNIALAYTLIYGHFGMPALGVRGAGYATACVQYLEVIALLTLFARDARRSSPSGIDTRTALREVLDLGGPTGLQFGAETLAFTAFTGILGSLSSAEIASHQIALAVIRTSFLPGVAVAEAASVLVGRALGQRRLDEADRVTYSALALAVGFMAACGVVFGTCGGAIARAFTEDDAVIAIATRLLVVAAIFQVLDAVNIVLRGALRGAKDVRFTAVVGTSIVWLCVPTSALLFGKMAGLGAVGGWFGFVFETTLASAILWHRYRRAPWRNGYVEPTPSFTTPAVPVPT